LRLFQGFAADQTGDKPRFVTPDGLKPNSADACGGVKIYTPVRFSNMNILIDNRKVPTEEFTFSGGMVGDEPWRHAMLTPPLLEVDTLLDLSRRCFLQPSGLTISHRCEIARGPLSRSVAS
jgi:hypothetical protein